MIGRRDELGRISQVLEGARADRAGALVVVGEAGIGKTSLLAAAEAAADGFRCLRARGVESESGLAHVGLLQVLGPVRHFLGQVSSRQRRALEAALGWGAPSVPDDRFLVAAATLSLLAAAAEEAPLLVVVDDLHWLDAESAAAVLFVARRISHDAVAVLLATRRGSPPGTALDGIDAVTLGGLSVADAPGVLPAGTAPAVIAQLVAATRGNPLALIEIADSLSPAQRRGAAELPGVLDTGDRLQAVYEPVLTELPPAGQHAVRLVAAAGDGAVQPVAAALRAGGLDADAALAEAERRGVLVREPGLVRFRHPLMRSAAWASATPEQRRSAHAALADALPRQGRARIWHLAEAAAGPDAELATLLETAACDDRERLGHAAASATLERAARLSPDPVLAAERLAAAVDDASIAGDVPRTRALAAEVLASDADTRVRGRALAALGILEQATGSIVRATQLLEQAVTRTDGRLRIRVLAELAMARHRLDDFEGLTAVADRMAATADRDDPEQRFLSDYFGAFAALGRGEQETGRRRLSSAVASYERDPHLREEPYHLVLAALACGWIGVTAERVRVIEDQIADTRARGALGPLVTVLAIVAHGRAFFLGDNAGAFADAGEAVELARELGYVADAAPALELLAWQHAARGAHQEATVELDAAARMVEQAGTSAVAAHLALARAFLALCRDDLDEVVALLEARLEADGGRGAMGEILGVAPMLVEAYAALGRADDAAGLTERYAAVPEPDERTQALIARCRGLVADDAHTAVEAFEAALDAHDRAGDPFERARTQLLLGARLRRSGQRVAARHHLRAARDSFAAMDLTLWVKRSTAELGASGENVRPRRRLAAEPLSSQETRVALLVARGLTNREVAAALFLSPKTVEHHLSSVYRKRGVRSRTELARDMGDGSWP